MNFSYVLQIYRLNFSPNYMTIITYLKTKMKEIYSYIIISMWINFFSQKNDIKVTHIPTFQDRYFSIYLSPHVDIWITFTSIYAKKNRIKFNYFFAPHETKKHRVFLSQPHK